LTSEEINKIYEPDGSSSPATKPTPENSLFWMKEIAYQLACLNEREDYRLYCLEEGDFDEEPTGGPTPIDA
jgi:hypothetical protein